MQRNFGPKNLKILFLDILTDSRKERSRVHHIIYGGKTYSEAMRRAFGLSKNKWATVYASHDKLPNTLSGLDAIVIGGSMHNSIKGRETPWMKRTFRFIKSARSHGVPILGICGGLQFSVRAFGGDVIRNPKGMEFGTTAVKLRPAGIQDPLFYGVSKKFLAQSSHRCMARRLKPGWKLLASSTLCVPQGVAVGKNVRLLQFHPEMTTSQLRGLARYKKEPPPQIKNAERFGKKILQNFIHNFALPYHKRRV